MKPLYKPENQIKLASEKPGEELKKRSTDIIVTMGPETDDRNKIIEMLHAGMDIARFELTYDNHEDVLRRMQNLREILALFKMMGDSKKYEAL